MAVIKCKMCGGDLVLVEGQSVAECEYCGSKQTVPTADNEKKLTLFARANRLRFASEFDKAAGIYEAIVADFPEEAEAYWGLVLCKYGIEYVDDPATAKKIPTCHRSSFDSIMEDSDFEQALENADVLARRVYREEAKQIEEIRKSIIAVSANEQPYDIFICYKETDPNGDRTLDSVLAQDIYDALTDKGYRVFFSRITLEDKLGQEYEPYIFAALNSAKIMLAVGTDYEYYNAVWVKNEWSRYLKLMTKDKDKHLIPCFKGIDAYDMPKEFAKLQAQDLGKIGAIQDLLRGIGKLLPRKGENTIVIQKPEASVSSMVTRGQFALDDGDFGKAAEFFERALDQNPEDGQAYLGKVLASLKISNTEALSQSCLDLRNNKDYDRAIRFTDNATAKALEALREQTYRRSLLLKLDRLLIHRFHEMKDEYYRAVHLMIRSTATEEDFLNAAEIFKHYSGFLKADERYARCIENARKKREEHLEMEHRAAMEAAYETYCQETQQIIQREIEEESAKVQSSAKAKIDMLITERDQKIVEIKEMYHDIEVQRIDLNKTKLELYEKRNALGLFKRKEKESVTSEIERISKKMEQLAVQQNGLSSEMDIKREYQNRIQDQQYQLKIDLMSVSVRVRNAHPIVSLEEYMCK